MLEISLNLVELIFARKIEKLQNIPPSTSQITKKR